MKTEILTVIKDPSNSDFYLANYSGDEAHNLAYKGTLCDAIEDALQVFGLDEESIFIEASN